jgi:hypothetical protein
VRAGGGGVTLTLSSGRQQSYRRVVITGTPSGDEQLTAIADLSRVFDRHGVDHWLFGGWAVDFWVGGVTREHDDIDVAAWRRDYDLIGDILRNAGWEHTPVAGEVVGTRYRLRTAEVEFTFVVEDDNGWVVVPLADQPVVWSTEPFGNVRRELLGVSCRTLPLALLAAGKSAPRENPAEAAKDRADYEALARLMSR